MPKLPVPPRRSAPPATPEALYDTLQGTDPGVRHLWAHQADALRTYHADHSQSTDVALEFPTGAGKTLVGCLIAEWRRQACGERVAFVCPTNQLANQAAQKARSYGIDVVLLIGSHRGWSQADVAAFEAGNAVAITNYHHIFNSDPKIGAQALIFDDAHAGEPIVAGRWTVDGPRGSALYLALREVVDDALPSHVRRLVRDDGADPRVRRAVELVPPTVVAHRSDEIARAIDTHAEDGSPAAFGWRTVRQGLAGCLMYVSWSQISLRPLVAPTATLPEFSEARQRVYMSATLGQAGELERSFGVASIARIPLPQGWERQGSGRRLALFPTLVGDDDQTIQSVVQGALVKAERSLIIAPSERQASEAVEQFVPSGMPIVTVDDISVNFDAFTTKAEATLVLANRYDGMDLPDDACRLVALHGLPFGSHLQERFLFETLGAREALDERIRTRITQGMGRATRNRQDFAAVLFTGQDLVAFVARNEVRAAMRPELQAELDLGLAYADDGVTVSDALEAFFEQGDDWRPVESHLREISEELTAQPMPGASALDEGAPHEVRAWAHIWRGDLARARDHALRAADALAGVAVKQYRGLWRYLAASWAQLAAEASDDDRDAQIAAEARRSAETAFNALPWYPRFEGQVDTPLTGSEYDWRSDRAAQWVDRYRRGPRLQRKLAQLSDLIASDEAQEFESGLQMLGEVLGFDSVRPNAKADPDGAWREGDDTWILWEAKTMEHDQSPLDAKDTRQANSHHTWVARELSWPEPRRSATIVVCSREEIDPTAMSVADERLALVDPTAVRDIASRAVTAVEIAATEAPALTSDQLRRRIGELFTEQRLGTDDLFAELTTKRIAST